jgi:nucleoside-diphosphate-sugar epimerase
MAKEPDRSTERARATALAPDDCVAVTGATGYVGSHVVEALLSHGYRVRAVVRDPGAADRTAHLRALARDLDREEALDLAPGDLLQPGSYNEALNGCEGVAHVASSVRLRARDPQREIVDVAVEGTRNVLESARRAGTVRRVVLTSSVAAVTSDDRSPHHVFTEADWNTTARLDVDPYPLAKTRAERAAWDLARSLPDEERFALVALNPVVVMGPLKVRTHNRSSPNMLRDLVTGKMPGCPRFFLNLVDVRDVALAHVRALERPEAQGRYLLHAEGLWMQEMARLLKPHFPELPIRTRRLPDLALYVAALFDKRLSWRWLRKSLGSVTRVDAARSREELDLEYRPVERTLVDTCRSFVDLGLARR